MREKENFKNKSDEELAGLVANNPDFYYLLMERYESKILRYIRRISNLPKETIEDLGQEIFLKAYENINDFDESLKFSSWLYRIARNHVISFWRKNKNTPMVVSFDADENFKNMLSAEGDLAKKIEAKDMAEIIGKILSQMAAPEVLTFWRFLFVSISFAPIVFLSRQNMRVASMRAFVYILVAAIAFVLYFFFCFNASPCLNICSIEGIFSSSKILFITES